MISINIYEILFQCINFIILMWLLWKFLSKPLSSFLDNRSQSIKNSIEKAETSKVEATQLLEEQRALLKKAHQDAQAIRTKAEESAKKEQAQILDAARQEAKNIVDATKKEIELEFRNAKKALTEQVAELSITLSEKLIQKNINVKDNASLIEAYIKQSVN